jgi:hypothetical protein
MQNVADGTSAPSEDRNSLDSAIVSDLVSLIECVRTSMELIDAAVAGKRPSAIRKLEPTSSSWTTSRPVT